MIRKTVGLLLGLALLAGLIGVLPAAAAVTLVSFTAEAQANGVLLTWETTSEIDNIGLNLLLSDAVNGQAILLATIPSQGPGGVQGFIYTYEDLAVEAGNTYYYWLQDISDSGPTTLHGPVSVYYGGPTAVTLSGVTASPAASAALPAAGGLMALLASLAGAWALHRRRA